MNIKYSKDCVLLTFIFTFTLIFSSIVYAGPKPSSAAIASAHPLATKAGEKILRQGGNAFDAAVAVTAALAVVEPSGSGLGGGGFYLLHEADKDHDIFVDAREMAPQAAHRDMYLDGQGQPIKFSSINGPLAAGIPGIPAALEHLAVKYGNLPISTSLAPAIEHAQNGFEVSKSYVKKLNWRKKPMLKYPATAEIFLDNNELPEPGWTLKQEDLATTLRAIANSGKSGFYEGKTAKLLVEGAKKHGGIWTLDDLKNYQIVERQPIRSTYHGINIISAPPPSSGGIALATMLNILERYDLAKASPVEQIHLITEAMRRAYRDRAEYLGDSDFVTVPTKQLIDPGYAKKLSTSIKLDQATSSQDLPGVALEQTGEDTTHFSIIDEQGNRVAATLSINLPFGAAFAPKGTGVLLNDEMDDFSIKPGTPNSYGLVGAEANAIAPGKRPLSSMSPTFLETKDHVAILGTPGGSRIITMVLHGILAFAQDKPVSQWVSQPRFHHQYLPDHIQFEPEAFTDNTQQALQSLGHKLKVLNRRYGNMQAISWKIRTNQVTAASDPRGIGSVSIVDTH